MTLQELLTQYGAIAFEKQQFLGILLGKNAPDWFYDMDKGTLTFGKLFTFKMQLIGSESSRSNTWMWAWANRLSGMPPRLLLASKDMRRYGKRHTVKSLTTPVFEMDDVHQGHNLAMVTSGLCEGKAYYRCPDKMGALYVLITNDDYPVDTRHPIERIAVTFPQFLQPYGYLNHKAALMAYCVAHEIAITIEEKSLTAEHSDGTKLTATFDEQGRLDKLTTTLKPSKD